MFQQSVAGHLDEAIALAQEPLAPVVLLVVVLEEFKRSRRQSLVLLLTT
jgi:hypothetical protein